MRGRKKGSTDKSPRKRKSFWTTEQLVFLRENFETMSNRDLMEHLNKSKSTITLKAKEFGLVKHHFLKMSNNSKVLDGCGIYGIYNKAKNKIYIGSSANMSVRIPHHVYMLDSQKHKNSALQQDWNSNISDFLFVILYYCSEQDLLRFEHEKLSGWGDTYNTNPRFAQIPRVITEKDKERIYARINKDGEDGCWICLNYPNSHGYGRIRLNNKEWLAHRLLYKIETGIDPGDNIVRHQYNNKLCCNPAHMKLGSFKDNALDSNILKYEHRREEFMRLFEEVKSVKEVSRRLGLEKHYGSVYKVISGDKRYKKRKSGR